MVVTVDSASPASDRAGHLLLVRQTFRDPDQPTSGRNWLVFCEALLGWRFQYEIEIDVAPEVKAGDFDIEIEE